MLLILLDTRSFSTNKGKIIVDYLGHLTPDLYVHETPQTLVGLLELAQKTHPVLRPFLFLIVWSRCASPCAHR